MQGRVVQVGQQDEAEVLIGHQGNGSGKAVYVAAMLHHLMPVPVAQEPAVTVVHSPAYVHVGRDQLIKTRFRQQPLIADFAASQHQAQPLRHVLRVGIDGSGGRDHADVAGGKQARGLCRAVVPVAPREIPALQHLAYGKRGVPHAERLENAVFHHVRPGTLLRPGNHFPGGQKHHVLVLKFFAEFRRRPRFARHLNHFLRASLPVYQASSVRSRPERWQSRSLTVIFASASGSFSLK